MSEMDAVFHQSSKQLLSLAKSLTNNAALQDKVFESLQMKHNVETIKKRKVKHKFTRHPDRLSLESENLIHPLKNTYSDSSVSFNYNKSCDISVTHSEQDVLNNNLKTCSKSPEQVYFSPNQSFCAKTHISVQPRNIDIEQKEAIKGISLENLHQDSSESKSKIQSSISKMHLKTNRRCSKISVSDKSHEVPISKNNTVSKKHLDCKLRSYLQRILSCMEEIRIIMIKGIELPDGAQDWERAQMRTTEFSSRFARNYLYPLGREIEDLQETTRSSGSISNRTVKNIHHRLLTTHQAVLQALQAYRSHMTTVIANALAERLQHIIEQTLVLCDVHIKYVNLGQTGSTKRENLIDILMKRCDVFIDNIRDAIEKRNQSALADSPRTKFSLMGYDVSKLGKPGRPKVRKRQPLDGRLSMYSISAGIRSRDAFWKRAVEALAKDKLKYNHVQSRYKTAGFKHRPPHEKPTVIELPTKSKLFSKRSSCLLRNTPITTPQDEDEIVTLVEMQKERECNSSNAVKTLTHFADCEQQSNSVKNVNDTHLQVLTPLIQDLCQQVCTKDGEAMSQTQLEILLKSLLGMALKGKINSSSDDKEAGPKKNGFSPCNDSVHEIAQKIVEMTSDRGSNERLPNSSKTNEHRQEILGKQTMIDTLKDDEFHVKNKKIKDSNSNTAILEKINVSLKAKSSCDVNDIRSENKLESEEVHMNKTKKANNGQLAKNKNKRRQTVTVTGAKNAQLICIRDEDSIVESADDSKAPSVKNKNEQTKESPVTKDASVSSEQGDTSKSHKKKSAKPANNNAAGNQKAKDLPADKSSKVSIKISRLPKKSRRQLVLLPKTQAFNVIQYKLQYSKFTKRNHMYRKSSTVQPWVIVDKISEHLLNDLLLSIAKEIPIDHLVESLYCAEFQ